MSTLRRAAPILVIGVLGAAMVFTTSIPSFCPMRILLHVPCPSCGLTRATRLALGGHFSAATAMHPLWFIVLPFLTVVGAMQVKHQLQFGQLVTRTPKWARMSGSVIVVLLVVVWIARFFGAFGGPVSLT